MGTISITTIERARRASGQLDPTTGDTEVDALLNALILSVSLAFEKHIRIPLKSEAQTEVHSIDRWTSILWLRSYFGRFMTKPTITTLKLRDEWMTAFSGVTAELTSAFTLSDDMPGKLLYDGQLPPGEDTVEVIYNSGMATTLTNFISAFPDISDAADKQIAHEYLRRHELSKGAINVQGAASIQQSPVMLLDTVIERLASYRRPAWG